MAKDEPIASGAATQPITEAGAPFNHADADVILRSSDNVDFKVFKLLLSMGSPFFEDMFSLPQSPETTADDAGKDGLPLIRVTETASVLGMLLAMCYPMGAVHQPALDKLEDVDLLLGAAIKYSVERVETRLREALVAPQYLQEHAVRVFAIACRYKLDAEARIAARASLRQKILKCKNGPELDLMSAAKLFSLLQYHETCITAAREAVASPFEWPELGEQFCINCRCMRTFAVQPATSSDAISNIVLTRLPDREAVEIVIEAGEWCSVLCSWSHHKQLSVGITRQLTDLVLSKMDAAVSLVSLDLQL